MISLGTSMLLQMSLLHSSLCVLTHFRWTSTNILYLSFNEFFPFCVRLLINWEICLGRVDNHRHHLTYRGWQQTLITSHHEPARSAAAWVRASQHVAPSTSAQRHPDGSRRRAGVGGSRQSRGASGEEGAGRWRQAGGFRDQAPRPTSTTVLNVQAARDSCRWLRDSTAVWQILPITLAELCLLRDG